MHTRLTNVEICEVGGAAIRREWKRRWVVMRIDRSVGSRVGRFNRLDRLDRLE